MTTNAPTKYNEATKAIAASARICWTCGGSPNPENFGGMCDACYGEHRQRLARTAAILREYGQENTETGRALTALGY